MSNDEIRKKKIYKKDRSQIESIFKTYDLNHETGLPYKR
jgi:hypothetical protein